MVKLHMGSNDYYNKNLLYGLVTKPQTAFTFNVLDEFLIDSLECKTSAFSFYSKLRRLTDNAFPDTLPVCLYIL